MTVVQPCTCGHTPGDHQSAGTRFPHPPGRGLCHISDCDCRKYKPAPLTLDVKTARQFSGRLAHAGVDPVRNARRCLDGVVQAITQADPPRTELDPAHVHGDTVACYLAVLEAIDELAQVRNDLAPYARAAREVLEG